MTCTWTRLTYQDGYYTRDGWTCGEHESITNDDQPPATCVRSTCLVCQAKYRCDRHATPYEMYQDNSATWLAGALAEDETKLRQLRELAEAGKTEKILKLLVPPKKTYSDDEIFQKLVKL